MKLSQLLEDSSVILKSPATELRVESRVVQMILSEEGENGLKMTIEHLVTRIHSHDKLDAKALSSGAILIKKRP